MIAFEYPCRIFELHGNAKANVAIRQSRNGMRISTECIVCLDEQFFHQQHVDKIIEHIYFAELEFVQFDHKIDNVSKFCVVSIAV